MSGGGDTPVGKHWKFALDNVHYLAGRITEDDPNTLMADIYAYRYNDVTQYISFNDDGTAANLYNPNPGQIDQVKASIEAHFNIELTQTSMATGVINMGEILPDWDTYQTV